MLAPAITGIPELVIADKNGFLYEPDSLDDFVAELLAVHSLLQAREPSQPHFLSATKRLDWIRHAARVQVRHNFNRRKNLESFADTFVERIAPSSSGLPHENSVLQQVQLPV